MGMRCIPNIFCQIVLVHMMLYTCIYITGHLFTCSSPEKSESHAQPCYWAKVEAHNSTGLPLSFQTSNASFPAKRKPEDRDSLLEPSARLLPHLETTKPQHRRAAAQALSRSPRSRPLPIELHERSRRRSARLWYRSVLVFFVFDFPQLRLQYNP